MQDHTTTALRWAEIAGLQATAAAEQAAKAPEGASPTEIAELARLASTAATNAARAADQGEIADGRGLDPHPASKHAAEAAWCAAAAWESAAKAADLALR